jgi:amidase
MAKSVRDVADLLTILVDPHKTTVPAHGYGAALNNQWSDFRVGSLDPRTWKFPDFVIKPVPEATEQMVCHNFDLYSEVA